MKIIQYYSIIESILFNRVLSWASSTEGGERGRRRRGEEPREGQPRRRGLRRGGVRAKVNGYGSDEYQLIA